MLSDAFGSGRKREQRRGRHGRRVRGVRGLRVAFTAASEKRRKQEVAWRVAGAQRACTLRPTGARWKTPLPLVGWAVLPGRQLAR